MSRASCQAAMIVALPPKAMALLAAGLDPADAWLAMVDGLSAAQARSRARRMRGSMVIGSQRHGSPLALAPNSKPAAQEDDQDDQEYEGFPQEQEAPGLEPDGRRELLADFRALCDPARLAARDRRTVRMAQIAAARQRVALALHGGDLFGFEDFHHLHAALYALPRARRERVSRGLRRRDAPSQADLFGDRQ